MERSVDWSSRLVVVYRERLAEQAAAEARAAAIVAGITVGTWYPGLDTPSRAVR